MNLPGRTLRRVVHITAPWVLVYYHLPGEILGLDRRFALVMFMVGVLMVDGLRLMYGWSIPGTRPFERRRISSASWAGFGFMLAFLLFPEHLVVPVILGMAWVDPLMGELRSAGRFHPLPAGLGAYIPLFVLVHGVFYPGYGWGLTAVLGSLAGISAVLIENYGPIWLDDDISMVLLPLLVTSGVTLLA